MFLQDKEIYSHRIILLTLLLQKAEIQDLYLVKFVSGVLKVSLLITDSEQTTVHFTVQ